MVAGVLMCASQLQAQQRTQMIETRELLSWCLDGSEAGV
jgi:hypothetical protein